MRKILSKKKQIISGIVVISLLVMTAGTFVYSWIIGDVTPNVRGDFSVGSSSGLVLTLGKNDGIVADLNEFYGLTTQRLEINECSSVDGNTIYARDYEHFFVDSNKDEIICFNVGSPIVVAPDHSMEGDYLETSFTLRLSYVGSESYYIYFLDGYLDGSPYHTGFTKIQGSTITQNGLNSLRVAMYVDGLCDSESTYQADSYGEDLYDSTTNLPKYCIFTNEAESNPLGIKTTAQLALPLGTTANKYYICQKVNNTNYGTTDTQDLHSFSEFAISNGTNNVALNGSSLPEGKKYLFKLNNSYPSVNITIRVWLEGMSEYCVDGQLAPDDGIRMSLYFVSFRVAG